MRKRDHLRKFSELSKNRQEMRSELAAAASETLDIVDKIDARETLYGKALQPHHKFVFRCYKCEGIVLLLDEIPFSPGGLSPVSCKLCGKLQPMIDGRRRYDTKLVRSVEEDVKDYLGKLNSTQAEGGQ